MVRQDQHEQPGEGCELCGSEGIVAIQNKWQVQGIDKIT